MPPAPAKEASSDFPRGGAASSALSSLEWRDATEKAAKELFAASEEAAADDDDSKQAKKLKKRSRDNQQSDKATPKKPRTDGAEKPEKRVSIHPLTFKKLDTGFTLLAVIKSISELELIVSLPHQMTGSISITEISDEITAIVEKVAEQDDDADSDEDENAEKMDEDKLALPNLADLFVVGQALPVVTISAQKEGSNKRKIELSIKPERLNANIDVDDICIGYNLIASVKSVEDNGYIMSLGFKNSETHGFLNKKHATAFLHSLGQTEKGASLTVGQTVYCTILNIDESKRTIALSAEPSSIAKAILPGSHVLSFPSLKPGLLIPTRVKSTVDNGGIIVTFMGLFDGNIELAHLGTKAGNGTDLDAIFKDQSKLQARILYVDNQRKRIGFTLLKNWMSWNTIEAVRALNEIEVGTIFEDVPVARLDGDVGVVLNLADGLQGYVHVSRTSDKETPTIDEKKHASDTTHLVRVVGYDFCDNLLQLSMKPSVLEAAFLRREDVQAGMIVKGTVTKVDEPGVFVSLADGISALIPTSHLAEGTVANPTKKFKVGSHVTGRVLSSDPISRKIAVTLKKPLIASPLPILSSHDPAMLGHIVTGWITTIKPTFCIVGFYNNVRAICPKHELAAHNIANPADVFSVGQVVTCRVIAVDKEAEKMTVSFKQAIGGAESVVEVAPGVAAPVKVEGPPLGWVSSAEVVGAFDGYVLVQFPNGATAFLEKNQVSDHVGNVEGLFGMLKKGTAVAAVIVIETGKKVHVSMKRSVVAQGVVGGLEVGAVVVGYVGVVNESNCIVKFLGGVTGHANTNRVAGHHVADVRKVVKVGQTVVCKVVKVASGKKVEVSMKPGDMKKVKAELIYMESLWEEAERVLVSAKGKKVETAAAFSAKFVLGGVVEGVVKQKAPQGWLVDVGKGAASGLLSVEVGKEVGVSVGAVVKARVVDVDAIKKVLDLRVVDGAAVKVDDEEVVKKVFAAVEAGRKVDAVVQVVKAGYLVLAVPSLDGCVAFAPVCHLNSVGDAAVLKAFRIDQVVQVTLLKAQDSNAHGLFAQRVVASVPIEKQAPAKTETTAAKVVEAIEVGKTYSGVVDKKDKEALIVSFGKSSKGRVPNLEAADSLAGLEAIHVGDAVEVSVVSVSRSKIDLSIRAAGAEKGTYPLTIKTIQPGFKTLAKITKIGTMQGLNVVLGDRVFGKVSLVDISDDLVADPTDAYSIGEYVECVVLQGDKTTGNIYLSMRKSLVQDGGDVTPPFVKDAIVKGYIKNISEAGVFVDVGYGFSGFVHIKDISDDFVKDWKATVKLGDIVTGKIVNVEAEAHKVKMSLKKADVDPTYVHVKKGGKKDEMDLAGISAMKAGLKVTGTIAAIAEYGVHIKVDGMNVKGLCHKSELSDKAVSSIESLYSVGDPVMAVVLKVDLEKNRVSFGLKASYFTDEDAAGEDDDEDEDDDEEDEEDADEEDDEEADEEVDAMEEDEDEEAEGSDDDENEEAADADSDDEEEDVMDVESEDEAPVKGKKGPSVRKLAPLDLGGAGWGDVEDSDDENVEEDDSDDEDESTTTNNESKKSKRAKKRAKQEEEDRIAQQELELLETKAPDSADAFERILMGSPNSSFLWIKFMAFHLQMAEIAKARDVGERALKTIPFRESQELINVWVALLNLENTYGDRESLIKLFERAVSYNEPKAMYLNLANIYERSEDYEELDALFKVMAKRFKESCKIWVAYGLSLLKRGNVAESRKILQRSLLSLAKRKHLKVVCKFAQMEFKHGEAERGRTLFEGIISHHPKRLDMWSVYLDMEIRNGDLENIRRLFERTIALKLSSKKMKFLFKKYLEFEKTKGTPEGVKHVKESAMEYVERISRD
ncbi:Protein RRP5 [Podochytrium sp. JEL0797]|nr:Protein RRP5 [Podochytrium sp. JEL0797]